MSESGKDQLLGRYWLIKPIAQGGMAELFLAKQQGPAGFEKRVVIKRVLPHLSRDPTFVEMFLDEARLAAQLAHPNIVAINDFGEVNGVYFLCMEHLQGCDLDAVLRMSRQKARTVPATIAALIGSAVCDGLHYAHTLRDESGESLGVVHRDISPSNIFLTFQGAIKILDFGIAKAKGKLAHTETGSIKGKLRYMSPEQARGEALDSRSDVFAIGLVLYELVVGAHPFARSTAIASMKAITEEDVPDPSTICNELPAQLGAILMKALKRDRNERYASANALRVELDDFLATRTSIPAASQLQGFLQELMEAPASTPPSADTTKAEKPQRIRTTKLPELPSPPASPSPQSARRYKPRWGLGLAATTSVALLLLGGGWLWRGRVDAPPHLEGEEPEATPMPLPPITPQLSPQLAPPPRSRKTEERPPRGIDPGQVDKKRARPPPPSSPALPPSTAAGEGYLTATCKARPDAKVFIDNSPQPQELPLRWHPLTAGLHTLKFEDATGAKQLIGVTIVAGKNSPAECSLAP